jgi:magnesium chelatase subunit I
VHGTFGQWSEQMHIDPRLASSSFHILPYTEIVGQEDVKLALELSYIAPRIGGVLISGQRGTAKSTAVRAFAQMVYGSMPTTLPINATEDRIVGGWDIEQLMKGEPQRRPGLLEEANGGMLYIDEVNLLEDHLVNIILDVSSTGVLVIEHEGVRDQKSITLNLVGTMNPEEGSLRPQLLDRFGLMVTTKVEYSIQARSQILKTVLEFDRGPIGGENHFLTEAKKREAHHKSKLDIAKSLMATLRFPEELLDRCVALADAFELIGHRGERVLALAACAYAALRAAHAGQSAVEPTQEDINRLGRFAMQHRRLTNWDEAKDKETLHKPTAELRKGR